jgi:catechol 2,3-dioxygenase
MTWMQWYDSLAKPPWTPAPAGELAMFTRRLDLNGLLREIEITQTTPAVGEGPKDL